MQTINFQCGHCRKIMGVQAAYLGKQVRCPHCQQVVLAPTQAPAPVPAPAAASAPAPGSSAAGAKAPGGSSDEHDSIFGEQIDEDLFGSPPKSKVELPEPPRPTPPLQLEPTVFQVPGLSPAAASGGAGPAPGPALPPVTSVSATLPEPPTTDLPSAPPDGNNEVGAIQVKAKVQPQSNILVTSLLIVLIPYSILVTIIALILYFNQQRAVHPLEMLPDLGNPPAKRVGQAAPPVLNLSSYVRYKADAVLPPHLLTVLGQPIRVGDLEVTPVSVEQKRVWYKWRTGMYKPELSEFETLVLNLNLKNVSKDIEFRPMDLAYDYLWKEEKNHPVSRLPYTHLELSTGKRYCGPFQWKPGARSQQGSDEYVDGQEEHNRTLQPGEEMKTVLVLDDKDQVPGALRNYRGKLLWRVQVRRGLVNFKDRDYSVTAVIGVQFEKDEIVRK
jgi:hypothetical protein